MPPLDTAFTFAIDAAGRATFSSPTKPAPFPFTSTSSAEGLTVDASSSHKTATGRRVERSVSYGGGGFGGAGRGGGGATAEASPFRPVQPRLVSDNPFVPFTKPATPKRSRDGRRPAGGQEEGEDEDEEDAEAAQLFLSQFVQFSPSPKRAKGKDVAEDGEKTPKKAKKAGGDGEEMMVGGDRAEKKADEPRAAPAPKSTLNSHLSTSRTRSSTLPAPYPAYPSTSRPLLHSRHPSIGTALSSLSLDTSPSSFSLTHSLSTPPPSAVENASSERQQQGGGTAKTVSLPALSASLAALLAPENAPNLPDKLVALLAAVVEQGTELMAVGGDGEAQRQAEEQEQASRAAEMPPPSTRPRKPRTLSSASSGSVLLSSSTSSQPGATPRPVPRSLLLLLSISLPARPHPPYPRAFSRPLHWVYESGRETYEEQREGRSGFYAAVSAVSALQSWGLKREEERIEEDEAGEGGGRKRRASVGNGGGGKGKKRAKGSGWSRVKVEEEEEELDGGEEEEAVEYVPRPSRSRAKPTSSGPSSAEVDLVEEVDESTEEDKTQKKGKGKEHWVRRSGRPRKSRE
ncbi:hypothetical protein JCM8097_001198 [Rhodosporidiobolus ruineniae]